MEFVAWEGPLLGPGSEWFWAAAQFVVVVISLVGIYRQLKSQGAANAIQRIETLEGEYSSSRMVYSRLVLAHHLRYEPPSLEGFMKARSTLDFFINLANLHEMGYLSLREIEATWGRSIQIWTALTAPLVEIARRNEGRDDLYDLSGLVARLRALDAKRGVAPLVIDEEAANSLLDYSIAMHTADLRQEADYRSGIIPTRPDTAPSEPLVPASGGV